MSIKGLGGASGVDPAQLRERLGSLRPDSQASNIKDRVTLSPAARSPLPEKLRTVSAMGHAEPKVAEQLAYDYAHTEQSPIIDISGLEDGSGPARYAATGEAVTPESERRYKEQAESLRAEMSSLYASEKAKKTPAAELLDKLLGTLASSPAQFQNVIGLNT